MPITLGINLVALNAQRRMSSSTDAMSRSLERLSSGSRLNRPSDDSAGLSVGAGLQARARIFGRANLNISDAVSALSIGDGTLSQTNDLLVRMQELAQQASNGALSRSQRISLDKEYQQLAKEIKRLYESSTFNGINVSNGGTSGRASRLLDTLLPGSSNSKYIYGLSADGRYLLYADDTKTAIKDTVTGTDRDISNGISGAETMQILNNGDVYFNKTASSKRDLYVYRYGSQTTSKITNSTAALDLSSFAVSADGLTVAFGTTTQYTDGGTLSSATTGGVNKAYVLDLSTGIIRSLNSGAGYGYGGNMKVSNDGGYVAVYDGGTGVYVSNTRGTSLTTKSTSGATIAGTQVVAVSNDGLASFTSSGNVGGLNAALKFQFFSLDWQSGSATKLTNNTTATGVYASASADGTSIVFVDNQNWSGTNSGGLHQVFKIDVANRQLTQTTSFGLQDFDMSYASGIVVSADGNRVYHDDISDGMTLYEIDTSSADISLNFEAGSGSRGNIASVLKSISGALRGLGEQTLTSSNSALSALDLLNYNLRDLASIRGTLGAGLSRVESAGRLVQSQRDENQAAYSRIADADVASESAQLLRTSILQQAGAALLAQANQLPSLAMQLLSV